MGIPGLPFDHSIYGTEGTANNNPISVPGIKATSQLLAVIAHDAASGVITGLDPSAFVVSEGEIESATEDTSGMIVTVIYTDTEELS